MTAEISGEKVVCRGVVHRLKEDKTALQAETETFGGAMKPLYVSTSATAKCFAARRTRG